MESTPRASSSPSSSRFIAGSEQISTQSNLPIALERIAPHNGLISKETLASPSLDYRDSSVKSWESYLVAVKTLQPKEVLTLGQQAVDILQATKTALQLLPDFKNDQVDALFTHIQALIDEGSLELAKDLLTALIQKELLGPNHNKRVASLWMQATVSAMSTFEDGMKSYHEGCQLGIQRGLASSDLSRAFCGKLEGFSGDGTFNARTAEFVEAFVLRSDLTASCREALSEMLLSYYQELGDNTMLNKFSVLSKLVGLEPLVPYCKKRLNKYISEGRLWAAMTLFTKMLALKPRRFNAEELTSYIHQIVDAVLKDGKPYLKPILRNMLLDMIAQAPHEIAGGLFPNFETMPEQQATFFAALVQAITKVATPRDIVAANTLVAMRHNVDPLLLKVGVISQRLEVDQTLANFLTSFVADAHLFFLGMLFAVDFTSKLVLLSSPAGVTLEKWSFMMRNRIQWGEQPIQALEVPTKAELEALRPRFAQRLQSDEVQRLVAQLITCASRVMAKTPSHQAAAAYLDFSQWAIQTLDAGSPLTTPISSSSTSSSGDDATNCVRWIRQVLATYSDPKEVPEDSRVRLHAYLQLMAEQEGLDPTRQITSFLEAPLVTSLFSSKQIAELWDVYLANILKNTKDAASLVTNIHLLAKHMPSLWHDATNADMQWPLSVDIGLAVLARLAYAKGCRKLFARASHAFFSAAPLQFYKGQAYGSPSPASSQLDYSLYLNFIDLMLNAQFIPGKVYENVLPLLQSTILEAIAAVPKGNKRDRSTILAQVERFLTGDWEMANASLVSSSSSSSESPALHFWRQVARTDLFNDMPFKGNMQYLLAAGAMPNKHAYKGAALVNIYLSAIQRAVTIDSAASLTLAIKLAGQLNRIMEGSPELRHTHIELFATALANAQITTEETMPLLQIRVRKLASWVDPALKDFKTALTKALDAGVYSANPELFYAHLRKAFPFYQKLQSMDPKRSHVMDLMKSATAKFADHPELKQLSNQAIHEWFSLIRPLAKPH